MGQILDCFSKGVYLYTKFTKLHQPEEAIRETGFIETGLCLERTCARQPTFWHRDLQCKYSL